MTSDSAAPPPVELGPFEPPEDFEHNPAFQQEPPRPMPAFARRSRYTIGRHTAVWSCLTIAAACWVTAPLPFVQTMSWYLLPLGYLSWCGAGMAVIAGLYWFRNATTWGLLDYVHRGDPLVGRVQDVGVHAEGTQEAPLGRFMAAVEFVHPESNELQTSIIPAPDTFGLGDASKMSSGLKPGDYVSLVALPGEFDKSLRIYGWLGIDPDRDFITKNGKPLASVSPLGVLLIVFGVMLAFWLLLSFVYVLEAYQPLDGRWQPYAIGIGLAAIPFVILSQFGVDRNAPSKWPMLGRRLGASLLGVFGGFMLGFPAVGFLNGYFDRSPRELEPVRIVQQWQTTWNFVIRNYELEYQPYPNGKTTKKTVPVETLSQFEANDLGVIDIGAGMLGMRWIRSFHPIVWQNVTEEPAGAYPGEVRCRLIGEDNPVLRLVPRVRIDESTYEPVPEALFADARQQLLASLTGSGLFEILKDDAE